MWIARRYWHTIGTRKWTFAVKIGKSQSEQEPRYLALEYATNTKIIRFKKIVAEANPFDERWDGYYEERDGEHMLNSTKGRARLLALWRSQKRCCPVCKDRITSETGFRTHTILHNSEKKLIVMVHPLCHRLIHNPDYSF